MKYLKTIFFGGALALLALCAPSSFGAHTNVAHAATIDCTPVSAADLAQITAIQKNSALSDSQELQQELALRQKLVGQTIACAQQDVQTVKTALNNVTSTDNIQTLQTQLSGQLDNVTTFYNIELTKLSGSGISGTQTIAKEVLDERQGAFLPLVAQIDNFILWSQNQTLFATAQTRMDQTSRAVTFLEAANTNSDLQTAFDSALASFNTAQSQNAAAKSALAELLPADQSLTLIKQSLVSLADTYQNFSTVSTLIKNILPQ